MQKKRSHDERLASLTTEKKLEITENIRQYAVNAAAEHALRVAYKAKKKEDADYLRENRIRIHDLPNGRGVPISAGTKYENGKIIVYVTLMSPREKAYSRHIIRETIAKRFRERKPNMKIEIEGVTKDFLKSPYLPRLIAQEALIKILSAPYYTQGISEKNPAWDIPAKTRAFYRELWKD